MDKRVILAFMKKVFLLLLLGFYSCIEKYDFNISQKNRGIVIQSFISNQSQSESFAIPHDGEFFKVLLSETSDVDNIRNSKVTNASVSLMNNEGTRWQYTEQSNSEYVLEKPYFKAQGNLQYQLTVILKEGDIFQSSWESMPVLDNQMGTFSIKEVSPETYVREADEFVIRSVSGINVYVDVPKKKGNETYNYQWSFEPLWQYTSSLASAVNSSRVVCWVNSSFYQKDFLLLQDKKGDFKKELFYLQTNGNDRVYQYFSTLVHQDVVSPEYYSFWKDLQGQDKKGGLYDQPPFGLETNFTGSNTKRTVNGYFGVVNRVTKRWTFDPSELSYTTNNNLYDQCILLDNEPGAKEGQCYYCDEYNQGNATTRSPSWW
ncbi:MAG: hypothetical protein ACI9QN_002703 [Arcticibacterium sp.]